jgi:hypothetical protein
VKDTPCPINITFQNGFADKANDACYPIIFMSVCHVYGIGQLGQSEKA